MTASDSFPRAPAPAVFPHTMTAPKIEVMRQMVICGRTAREIAEVFETTAHRVERYLCVRRPRWLEAHNEGRVVFLPEKTVIFRRRSRADGGYDIKPYSVAAVSMHRDALQARP